MYFSEEAFREHIRENVRAFLHRMEHTEELKNRVEDGEAIHLDCKNCGVPTKLTEDHLIVTDKSESEVKTYGHNCITYTG